MAESDTEGTVLGLVDTDDSRGERANVERKMQAATPTR
jgi:hypothetical protein